MHPGRRSNGKSKSQPVHKTVVYHPLAQDELIEAALFYESRSPGLGDKFLNSVERALDFICRSPFIFRADKLARRKYIMKKFPYLLIYKVKEDSIFILALAHGRRKPGYWKSRDI